MLHVGVRLARGTRYRGRMIYSLTNALGRALRRVPSTGPVSLFRLGSLVFRVVEGRVTAIAVGSSALAVNRPATRSTAARTDRAQRRSTTGISTTLISDPSSAERS